MIWLLGAAALLVANMVLQLLDIWTTVVALQAGGTEQNAFSRAVMETFGLWAWVAVKLLLVVALGVWLWWLRDAAPGAVKRSVLPAAAMAAWMAMVIANNLRVLASI